MQDPAPTLHHPVPRLALLCFSGILLGTLSASWMSAFSAMISYLCWVLAGCSLLLAPGRKYPCMKARALCTLALFLFCFWRGVDPVQLHQEREEWIARHLVPLDRPLSLSGRVKKTGRTRTGNVWADLARYTVSLDGVSTHGQGIVRVYDASPGAEDIIGFKDGDRVTLEVRYIRQTRLRVPDLFDPQAWRVREGFHAEATIQSVISVDRRSFVYWKRPFAAIASNIRDQLDRMPMAEPMKSILRAILTGDRSGLDTKTEVQLARAGVAHVMAVSGLHVGLITAPFWWLFMKVRAHWIGLFLWFGTGVILLLYVEVASHSPSVSRAALMCWLGGWLMIPLRKMPSSLLLMIAGTILVIWKPLWIQHPGFQLSMVAVWSILILHAPVERELRRLISTDRVRSVLSMVAMTAIIQVALTPLLVWWFGEISVVAPLSNLFVVPLVPVLTLFGWGWTLLDGLSLNGSLLLVVAHALMEWILYWTERFSNFSHATMTPGDSLWFLLVPALIMSIKGYAWVRDSRKRTHFWYMISILLLCGYFNRTVEERQLIVNVLDVGQGDAIHIETPNGYNMMIDTGSKRAAEHVLIPYLNEAGVTRLDALLLTHPHTDHVGGATSLMKEISVGGIYRTPWNMNEQWVRSLKRSDLPNRLVYGATRIELDPSIRVYILESRVANPNVNNHSLVVKLVYGETSILFSGDAERVQESGLVRTYGTWLGVDVLKAGHHGSRTSSNPLFLQFVNPAWSVISAGEMNRYGHPHREVMNRLHRQGSRLLITAQSGTVRIVSNGTRIAPVLWN